VSDCNLNVYNYFQKFSRVLILKTNDKFYPLARNIGIIITIPMVFVAGPVIGLLIGQWIDQKWLTDPWAKVILSLLGFIGSIKQVIALIKRATKETEPQ
jgi:F0F1-type ATP synthase assembly protein I